MQPTDGLSQAVESSGASMALVSNGIGMASPLYSLSISHWTWSPSELWTLGKEALQLRQTPKGIDSWRLC